MIERDFDVPFVADLARPTCSYRLANVKSAAQVALEAGNSPQRIFEYYRERVTEKVAKAPRAEVEKERAAKIVAFPAKAAA
jgi:hypothetical protein